MATDGEEQEEGAKEGGREGAKAPGLSHCLCEEVQEYEEMTISEIMTGKSTYDTIPPSLPPFLPLSPPSYTLFFFTPPSLPPSLSPCRYFPGLIPLCYAYLEYIECDSHTGKKVAREEGREEVGSGVT